MLSSSQFFFCITSQNGIPRFYVRRQYAKTSYIRSVLEEEISGRLSQKSTIDLTKMIVPQVVSF